MARRSRYDIPNLHVDVSALRVCPHSQPPLLRVRSFTRNNSSVEIL